MKKLNLNFSEMKKFSHFDNPAKEILHSMIFPTEGEVFEGNIIKMDEEESVDVFLDRVILQENVEKFSFLETAISFAASLKLNEEEGKSFLVRDYDNTLCIVSAYSWGKGNNNFIKVLSTKNAKNHYYQNGLKCICLFVKGEDKKRFLLEEDMSLPDETFKRYIFPKRSFEFPVLVDPTKEKFFIEKEGVVEKIERCQLSLSVQKFLDGKIGTTILASFSKNNTTFSLMENGLLFNGAKVYPKNTITKEEYENLIKIAVDSYRDDEIFVFEDITPCLFYEK